MIRGAVDSVDIEGYLVDIRFPDGENDLVDKDI
jgi:hypothetical protein